MIETVRAYQILLLGHDDSRRELLRAVVRRRIADLGLDSDAIQYIDEQEADEIDPRIPLFAVFFGWTEYISNSNLVQDLLDASTVIAPLVSSVTRVHAELPPQLTHLNALEIGSTGFERLATLILENFQLLRKSRKLFISYKRKDVQPFADRLYDALDARGFDVFIDVRSVPPAVDFQAELWHRVSDSDVVVLIDTPGFRESRWTTAELARANSTSIQILHLTWPGQKEDSASCFSRFFELTRRDFVLNIPFKGQFVTKRTLERICDETERLRARAIAARQRYLINNFCDAATDIGMAPSVQPERWISIDIRRAREKLAVVPAVGIPTSDRINAIFDQIMRQAESFRTIWIIYDSRGVLNSWLAHVDWLNEHLPLRTVQMSEAPKLLRELLA